MIYVLALASGFACSWFIVAALQSFDAAGPARPINVAGALITGALSAGLIWLGRRVDRSTLACLAAALLAAGVASAGLGGVGLGGGDVASAAGEQIVISTNPPLNEIHPHGGPSAGLDPDTLIVEVKDGAGRNVPNVKLDVHLVAPPTNWFVSTDVPRIEGQDILDWSAVSADGRQEFQYLVPIRGAYHLTIQASPAPGSTATFSPITKDTELSISEKPKSVLYLLLFLSALFIFGVISGAVLGRAHFASRRQPA
jgi:hypothetical protein